MLIFFFIAHFATKNWQYGVYGREGLGSFRRLSHICGMCEKRGGQLATCRAVSHILLWTPIYLLLSVSHVEGDLIGRNHGAYCRIERQKRKVIFITIYESPHSYVVCIEIA